MAPARCSRASASVVLPAPPWPTSATLRILAVGNRLHVDPPRLAHVAVAYRVAWEVRDADAGCRFRAAGW